RARCCAPRLGRNRTEASSPAVAPLVVSLVAASALLMGRTLMTRFTWLPLAPSCRLAFTAALLSSLTLATPARAIVPTGRTVGAGACDAGAPTTSNGGARGTATLFGRHYSPAPANPQGAPQRYLNLCFLTADHVLRPLLPGGIVNDPMNDQYPGGSI